MIPDWVAHQTRHHVRPYDVRTFVGFHPIVDRVSWFSRMGRSEPNKVLVLYPWREGSWHNTAEATKLSALASAFPEMTHGAFEALLVSLIERRTDPLPEY